MRSTLALSGILTAVLLGACGGGGGGGGNGPSVTIAKAGAPDGDAQSAAVATALPAPLRVLVLEDGAPKVGATVAWTTTSGGSLSPTSSPTDGSGIATSQWTLGTAAGGQTARAALAGASGSPVSFTASGLAGAPASLVKAGGDNQSGIINVAFDTALSAKVADQFGNGIGGVTVNWAVQSGPVTLTGGATSVTGPSGVATKAISGGGAPGSAVVRASSAAVGAVNLDYSLAVTLAPVQVLAGPSGTTSFRSVKNASANPAVDTAQVGQPVRWSVTGSHTVESLLTPSFTSSGNLLTGSTYTIIFSAPGTYQYDCAIHGSLMTGRVVVIP